MNRSTPQSRDVRDGVRVHRQTALELARIYVASSAYTAALDSLSSLPENGWDEEIHLLRAEALIGLGRLPEAARLVGPPVLPETKGLRALDSWRFLLQLRILHRRGEYRRVTEIGRAYFDAGEGAPSVYLARTAMVVAQSMLAQKCPADAREFYRHVLGLYERLGSQEGQVDALLGIANTHLLDCQWDKADAIYQEARFRYEELGLTDKALAACINLGVVRVKRGEFRSGRDLLEDALERSLQLGAHRRTMTIRLALAMAEIRSGRGDTSRDHLAKVIRAARRDGVARDLGLALEFLGELHLAEERWDHAEQVLGRALRIGEAIAPEGDIVFEVLRRLAEVALRRGQLEPARRLAQRSKRLAESFGDSYEVATCHRVLAEIAWLGGDRAEALNRVDSASTMLGRLGETFERGRLELLRDRWTRTGPTADRPIANGPDATRPGSAGVATRRGAERDPRETPWTQPGTWKRFPGRAHSLARDREPSTSEARYPAYVLVSKTGERGDATLRSHHPDHRRAVALAKSVARLDIPVLLTGERGTGLEPLSRWIHQWSGRSGPYVPFHCAGVEPKALRRELFGRDGRSGLATVADGGTVFLDSITSLGPESQRCLAEWVRGLSHRSQHARVRVVAAGRSASGRPATASLGPQLRRALESVVIDLPPLRERQEDIPMLVLDLLRHRESRFGIVIPPPPGDWIRRWQTLDWPGNLDELRDVVDRYVLAALQPGDGNGTDFEATG